MTDQRTEVRLLHTSDLHMGEHAFESDSGIDEAAQRVLKGVVDVSIEVGARLLIVAGDLFDNNRVGSAIAEAAAAELLRAVVPVIIVPGNHDTLTADSIYRRVPLSKLAPNVRVLTEPQGERLTFPELDLAVWGKPITSYSGKCCPMAGVPPRGKERWQVAVAHGYYVSEQADRRHSDEITHEEIIRSGFDYVALGHWSTFRCVSDSPVKACYSGSASYTGSVITVDLLEGGGVRVQPHPLPV